MAAAELPVGTERHAAFGGQRDAVAIVGAVGELGLARRGVQAKLPGGREAVQELELQALALRRVQVHVGTRPEEVGRVGVVADLITQHVAVQAHFGSARGVGPACAQVQVARGLGLEAGAQRGEADLVDIGEAKAAAEAGIDRSTVTQRLHGTQLPGLVALVDGRGRCIGVRLGGTLAAQAGAHAGAGGELQVVLDVERLGHLLGGRAETATHDTCPVVAIHADHERVVEAKHIGTVSRPGAAVARFDVIGIGVGRRNADRRLVACAEVQAELPVAQISLREQALAPVVDIATVRRVGGLPRVGVVLVRRQRARQAGVQLVLRVPGADTQPLVAPLARQRKALHAGPEVVTMPVARTLVARHIERKATTDQCRTGAHFRQRVAADRHVGLCRALARLAGGRLGGDDDRATGRAFSIQHRAAAADHFDAVDRIDGNAGQACAAQVGLGDAHAVDDDHLVAVGGAAKATQVERVVTAAIKIEPARHAEQFHQRLVDGGDTGVANFVCRHHAHAEGQRVGIFGEPCGRHQYRRQQGRDGNGLSGRSATDGRKNGQGEHGDWRAPARERSH